MKTILITFVFIGISMMEKEEGVCRLVLGLHHLASVSVHDTHPYLREGSSCQLEVISVHITVPDKVCG